MFAVVIRIVTEFLMCADVKPSVASSRTAAESSGLLSPSDGGAVPKRHKAREHKRVYRCSLCNKVFQNSSNLNRHVRSHGTHNWFLARQQRRIHRLINTQLTLDA